MCQLGDVSRKLVYCFIPKWFHFFDSDFLFKYGFEQIFCRLYKQYGTAGYLVYICNPG